MEVKVTPANISLVISIGQAMEVQNALEKANEIIDTHQKSIGLSKKNKLTTKEIKAISGLSEALDHGIKHILDNKL